MLDTNCEYVRFWNTDTVSHITKKMKIQRISAYTIEKEEGKHELSLTEYSKFKYGHKSTSIKFAQRMISEFLEQFTIDHIANNCHNVIVSTSPYWYTPPSAHSLAVYFHFMLNDLMLEKKHSPLTFLKIHRSSAPVCDFSTLTHAERLANLGKENLSIDPTLLKGKTLFLIEDARITGTHEQKIIDFMEKAGLEEIIFIYVINISFGKDDPTIESRLNHEWVNDLDTIQLLMRRPDQFLINSRLCRFILSWKDKDELADFCKRLSDEMIFELYMSSINDCYNANEKYADGFEVIRNEIEFRHRQLKKSDDDEISIFVTKEEEVLSAATIPTSQTTQTHTSTQTQNK